MIRTFVRDLLSFSLLMISLLPPGDASASTRMVDGIKLFAGRYQGNCRLQSSTGDDRFYIPVRFTISKKGTIKGTVTRDAVGAEASDTHHSLKGRVKLGRKSNARISMKFGDGTIVKGGIRRLRAFGQFLIAPDFAIARQGDYTGTCSFPKQ